MALWLFVLVVEKQETRKKKQETRSKRRESRGEKSRGDERQIWRGFQTLEKQSLSKRIECGQFDDFILHLSFFQTERMAIHVFQILT